MDKVQTGIYISEQVKRDAQIRCIEHKTSLSIAIEELLKKWLAGEVELPVAQ